MKVQGIIVFLIIAYGIPYGAEAALILTGAAQEIDDVGGTMWTLWGLYIVTAAGAWTASRIHPLEGGPSYTIIPVPWLRAVGAALAAAVISIIAFVGQMIAGVVEPDWELTRITRLFEENNLTMAADPAYLLFVGFTVTVILGFVLYAPVSLAGEYAWRGFLLPRLLPLGRVRAYILTGLAWGLWFAPLAFTEILGSAQPWSTVTRVLAMAIVLSFILGELTRRTGSLVPGAALVGGFAVQIGGMTVFLVPQPNAPWSGSFGYVSIGVWLVAALVVWYGPQRRRTAAD